MKKKCTHCAAKINSCLFGFVFVVLFFDSVSFFCMRRGSEMLDLRIDRVFRGEIVGGGGEGGGDSGSSLIISV